MSQPTTTSNESAANGESILSLLSPQERAELPPRGDIDLPLSPIEPELAEWDRQWSRAVGGVAIPEGLHERILRDVRKLERMRRGERQLRRWSVVITGLAASLLLVMLIQPFFRSSRARFGGTCGQVGFRPPVGCGGRGWSDTRSADPRLADGG